MAVVGIGWVAIQHITAFRRNPQARVVLLCTRDERRAAGRLRDAGIEIEGVRYTSRYEDVLKAPDVDIVAIATPNHLHARQAVLAARAGKHILVEMGKAAIPVVHPLLDSQNALLRKMATVVLSRINPREFGGMITGTHITG